ncbi:Rv1535 domain-containing protein [Mycobacterium terramassiliense]|uniref:Rv1535 domain-containing protein n=1 Tax=Mycobacterium terramassiliense TaxID=1841859 RepID=UPI0031836D33
MSTMTDLGGDPLVSSIASVLKVPLVELYALLWRVGVVEIRHSDRAVRPSSRARQVRVAVCPAGAACPNLPQHGSERPPRRSLQRRRPGPVPSRPDPAVCSRATG